MIENKDVCLKKIDNCEFILNTIYNDKVDEIGSLEYLESNCKPVEFTEKKNKIEYKSIVFFDFETYVDKKDNNKHKTIVLKQILKKAKKAFSLYILIS